MENKSKLIQKIQSELGTGNILLIVPPFAPMDRPSLAVHLLQAAAVKSGFNVDVLYANLIFAHIVGEDHYKRLASMGPPSLLCERIFARCAYGVPPLGHDHGSDLTLSPWLKPREKTTHKKLNQWIECTTTRHLELSLKQIFEIERNVDEFITIISDSMVHANYSLIGCTSTLQQHAPSIALLNKLKKEYSITTVIGGANCDGDLAQGTPTLCTNIDYIFSGESDHTFPDFLNSIFLKNEIPNKIIKGYPVSRMDNLHIPDYTEFYDQISTFILGFPKQKSIHRGSGAAYNPEQKIIAESLYLNYETSRGCWWGEKHHCTFCGLNGEGMGFREKSPKKVVEELKQLLSKHPNNRIVLTDNIMPNAYYKTLIKDIPKTLPGLQFFWEQKSNISLKKMIGLFNAGVKEIQPGIESLSSPLLKLMDKGVTARQNIATLRFARALGVDVHWNLIWAFPNDKISWYEETLKLIPLIRHLKPGRLINLCIDRFSPYYEKPENYSITNLEPLPAYKNIFPKNSNYDSLAYHFTGTYPSESLTQLDVMYALGKEVEKWLDLWTNKQVPECTVIRSKSGKYLLIDNRFPEKEIVNGHLSKEEARIILIPEKLKSADHKKYKWALDNKLVIQIDSYYVPLATANSDLLLEFETEKKLGVSIKKDNHPSQMSFVNNS